MKKTIFHNGIVVIALVAIFVAAFATASCATSGGGESYGGGGGASGSAAAKSGPIIGAEGVPQPDWVRNPGKMESADMMYFVGEGRTGKTTTAKKNSALADASRQVGEWKESTIKSAIKDYVDESGETGNTQSLEKLQVSSIQRAQADTSGIRQMETWIDQNSNYVILVSYPKADLKNSFKTAVNTFVRNESAAFADFKAEEAFKYLDSEIDKK